MIWIKWNPLKWFCWVLSVVKMPRTGLTEKFWCHGSNFFGNPIANVWNCSEPMSELKDCIMTLPSKPSDFVWSIRWEISFFTSLLSDSSFHPSKFRFRYLYLHLGMLLISVIHNFEAPVYFHLRSDKNMCSFEDNQAWINLSSFT